MPPWQIRASVDARPDDTGLDELDVATHPARDASAFRRIVAARMTIESAEEDLSDAVR